MNTRMTTAACFFLVSWSGSFVTPPHNAAVIKRSIVAYAAQPQESIAPSRGRPIAKDDIEQADVSILFIGNSHSAPIPGILSELFKSQLPNQKVLIAAAPSWGFLAEHAERNSTVSLIKQGPWDYVVLQAQKYSTTGKYSYPYDGALKLSKIASAQGAKIIMYPEWSRREVPDEYKRINQIHNEIAKQTGAVVAPIGQAWERALKKNSKLKLYASDGNHASPLGSYLNACVFFSMVTGNAISELNLNQPKPTFQFRIETLARH